MYAVEEVFYKKGILTSFAKVTGKHLYRNLFFLIKLQAGDLHLWLETPNFFKKRDCDTSIFLQILRNFRNTHFVEHL